VNGQPQYELYDLKEDPFESTNLKDKNRDQLIMMMQTLADELKDKGAHYPEREGEPLELIMPD
jgi:hypothetical protein